jgi:hypothetical protein
VMPVALTSSHNAAQAHWGSERTDFVTALF